MLGHKETETDQPQKWRILDIADETRRATVPYDIERDEETIVVGMQLDFTASENFRDSVSPDGYLEESAPLPILWVLNRYGELAGWSVVGSGDIEPAPFSELRVVLYKSPSSAELSHWSTMAASCIKSLVEAWHDLNIPPRSPCRNILTGWYTLSL